LEAKNNIRDKIRLFVDYDETRRERGLLFTHNDSSMCRENNRMYFKGGKFSFDIELKFRTLTEDGLLWMWNTENPFVLSIYLKSGRLNAELYISNELKFSLFDTLDNATRRLNDGNYHTIKVTLSRTKPSQTSFQLSFSAVEIDEDKGEIEIGKNSISTNTYFSMSKGTVCIGGISKTGGDESLKGPQLQSIKGCFIHVHMSANKSFDPEALLLDDVFMSDPSFVVHRVKPNCGVSQNSQCRLVEAEKPAYLHFDVKTHSQIDEETIGVSFATTSLSGVLFYRRQQTDKNKGDAADNMILTLDNGRLIFQIVEGKVDLITNNKVKLNDNKIHNVFVTREGTNYKLRVDNNPEIRGQSEVLALSGDDDIMTSDLFVGGVDEASREDVQSRCSNASQLVGCIIEVVYNNKRLDLETAVNSSSAQNSQCYT
jgi:hypothetical protein